MSTRSIESVPPESASSGRVVLGVLVWAWVILPFLYGLYRLMIKIPALFGS